MERLLNNIKQQLVGETLSFYEIDNIMTKYFYSEDDTFNAASDEILESGSIDYSLKEDTDVHFIIRFKIDIMHGEDEAPQITYLKVLDIELN